MTWKNRKEWNKKIEEIKNTFFSNKNEKKRLMDLIHSINEKMKKRLYEYKVHKGYMEPNERETPYPNPRKSELKKKKKNENFEYKWNLKRNNYIDKTIRNNYNYNANRQK